MKKKLLKLTLISLASASIFGCATAIVGGVVAAGATGAAVETDPRSADGVVDDRKLRSNVADAISAIIPGSNVEVTSYDANVLLTGQVISEDNKLKAENVALQVPRVKLVKNYITVGKTQSAGQTSKDAYLTSIVKSNMLFSKGISSNDVKVVTTNGVVYLMGRVDKYQAKKMVSAAKAVDGVKQVVELFEIIN